LKKQQVINYRVINRRHQPVEVFCKKGVVILPPLGEIILSADDQSLPQVQSLLKRRLISVCPHEVALPQSEEDKSKEDKRKEGKSDESKIAESNHIEGKNKKTSAKKSKASPKEK